MFEQANNCWQIADAKRVSVLVDGAAYFAAFRETVKQAQHSVLIVGWDIDSRTRLLRCPVPDDLPVELGAFLDAVVERRPTLQVYLLSWDFAALYLQEREWFARFKLQWRTHERFHFALDSTHAVAGSHHQKIVVVDDAVAFVGGLDLTKRRWDTPARRADDPRRTDTEGERYPPFHDLQMMVDGEAAAALGRLLRKRWQQATGEQLSAPAAVTSDPWPNSSNPIIHNANVAIARTEPGDDDKPAVREVEQLYLDMIATARETIYIENQYLTSHVVGAALCDCLQTADGPEVLMVLPMQTSGWLEQVTMDVLRARLLEKLTAADTHGRLRIYYPIVPELTDACVNVHAKLMIVDDRVLRIGSANLSNRSMGLDTECDLAIEAHTDEHRVAIKQFRNQLLSQHLGVEPAVVSRAIAGQRSLIAAVESLRGGERTLQELDGQVSAALDNTVPAAAVIDPEQPLATTILLAHFMPGVQLEGSEQLLLSERANHIALLSFGLALRWTPLARWLDAGLDRVQRPLDVSLSVLETLKAR
ncbi:MAG: phospholipase D-like domain-containing protein [Candidatus Competibacteraceae bacterium]|nr:phospholipase D-like domain-containing protein [Candidatus Competibacteraceae bacterium]